jgi:hypothetical protein
MDLKKDIPFIPTSELEATIKLIRVIVKIIDKELKIRESDLD